MARLKIIGLFGVVASEGVACLPRVVTLDCLTEADDDHQVGGDDATGRHTKLQQQQQARDAATNDLGTTTNF